MLRYCTCLFFCSVLFIAGDVNNNSVNRKIDDVVMRISKILKWSNNVFLVTDLQNPIKFIKNMSRFYAYLSVIKVSNNSAQPFLKSVVNRNTQCRFIVHCETTCLHDVIQDKLVLKMYQWVLIYSRITDFENDVPLLTDNLRIDSLVYAIIPNETLDESWILVQYRKVCNKPQVIAYINQDEVKWNNEACNTPPLTGINLTASVFHYPPGDVIQRVNGSIIIRGTNNDLIHLFSKFLGFRLTVRVTRIEGDTHRQPFVEQISLLVDREIDFGGILAPVDIQYINITTSTVYVFSTSSAVVFRNVKYISMKAKSHIDWVHLQPFARNVWLWILVFVVICEILSLISTWCVSHSNVTPSWLNVLVEDLVSIYPSQGFVFKQSKSTSKKIVIFVFVLFTFLIFCCYCSVLIASLTAHTYKIPFETIEDMVDDGRFVFGSMENSVIDKRIQRTNIGVFSNMKEKKLFNALDYSVWGKRDERILGENFAVIWALQFYINHNCSYVLLKKTYFPVDFTWYFQRSSPYVEEFSKFILHAKSVGILQKIVPSYTRTYRPQCELAKKFESVHFSECLVPFCALFIGVTIGFGVLVIEIAVERIY